MKRISQFSPASFLFQGAKPKITNNRLNGTGSVTGTTSTTSASTTGGLGTDRATLGGGGGLSLGEQMNNLKTKVGKASSSWLQQTRQNLGLESKDSKAFKSQQQDRGYDVKGPDNRDDFTPQKLDGKPVAFRVKDEATGEMVEKKGFLKRSGEEGSSSFKLDGQKGEFDSKHIHDFAVNNDPKVTPGSQKFRDKFEDQGWTAKHHRNSNDFFPDDVKGREVAFRTKDPETGKMVEHRGVMERAGNPDDTAVFKLKGQEGEFNNNYIKDMAVNDSFDKKMAKDGWTVKNGSEDKSFDTGKMSGKEVAFRKLDPKTGEVVEHRGILEANPDPKKSGQFRLQGQEGDFKSNDLREMAVNDRFSQKMGEDGWTLKKGNSDSAFGTHEVHGKEVAFRTKDPETGKMVERHGVLVANADPEKPHHFQLLGQKGDFEANQINEMAVNDKFGKKYRDEGWTVKNQHNMDQFTPEQMDGQFAAFRHPDPESGQMMEHMGKVQAVAGLMNIGMTLFTLVGMSSMYNAARMPEMALSPYGGADPSMMMM